MVRVGGGWDTLDHFLLKHDPCRIRGMCVCITVMVKCCIYLLINTMPV